MSVADHQSLVHPRCPNIRCEAKHTREERAQQPLRPRYAPQMQSQQLNSTATSWRVHSLALLPQGRPSKSYLVSAIRCCTPPEGPPCCSGASAETLSAINFAQI